MLPDDLPAGFALGGKKWDGVYVGRRMGADLVYAGIVPGRTLMGQARMRERTAGTANADRPERMRGARRV